MKKILFCLFASISLMLTSCARHITVNFQDSSENTGTVVIAPTANIYKSVLTLDDKLLVDKKYVKKITVRNVPIGEHSINFSADSWQYKDKINEKMTVAMQKDKEVAKIVTRPPYSTGYYIYMAACVLVAFTPVVVVQ